MSDHQMSKKPPGIHCDKCNAYIPNKASLNAHLKGKRHIKNVERIKSWQTIAERSLYITGIESCGAAELELADYFSQFGSISKITVDKDSGHFAILEFSETISAKSVLEGGQHMLGTQRITVKPREVKVPTQKKNVDSSHHNTHHQLPQHLWHSLMEAESVNDQFQVADNLLSLSAEDIHLRELLCKLLHSALVEVFPACEIQPFGSSVNGFGVHGCDLDLNFKYFSVDYDTAIQFLKNDYMDVSLHSDDENNMKELDLKQVLAVIGSVIKQCVPDCYKVKAILSARRPVVKFNHKASNMNCDISVGNDLAVRNTLYLRHCSSHDVILPALVRIIRSWMKHWNLAGSPKAASPLLNNYAVTLLVLFYLHNCDPKRLHTIDELRSDDVQLQPCEIENWDCSFSNKNPCCHPDESCFLRDILSGFFHFYSKVEFSKKLLSLKSGKFEDVPVTKSPAKRNSAEARTFKFGALNIQDPFELNHNVAGNVGQKHMFSVVKCIRNAALSCGMKSYTRNPADGPKREPFGILNLFIDHHSKRSTDPNRAKKNEAESKTFVLRVKKGGNQVPTWHEDTASLVLTVMSDVFLITVRRDNDEMEQEKCALAEESVSDVTEYNNTAIKLSQKISNGSTNEENKPSEIEGHRKRARTSSPVYEKRARLALSSPDALHLKRKAVQLVVTDNIKLPFTVQCEATCKLWEGRRKARRQLVRPGMSDLLDLEREVSKLLLSESIQGTAGTSDINTSLSSDCSIESHRTSFSFNLEINKSDENTLAIRFIFIPISGEGLRYEQDFQNFYHHFEIFLPKILSK